MFGLVWVVNMLVQRALFTDRCVGVSQVALTWRLAGNGKFVRRNLAVVLCNLSRHPDAFEQILEDGIVEV